MQAENRDAFGNLIHEPSVSSSIGGRDTFGNAIHNDNALVDPSNNVSSPVLDKSAEKPVETKEQLVDEIRKIEAEIRERYPNAKINASLDQNASVADLQKIRDEAASVKRGEEAKELQEKLGGGLLGLGVAASVFSGAKDPSVLQEDVVSPNGQPRNIRFDELLKSFGDKKVFSSISGGESVSRANSLSVTDGLPDLLAATRGAELPRGA